MSTKKFSDETMQSSSSNGSSASASSSTGGSTNNSKNKNTIDMSAAQPNGELFLLYRYLRNRKVFHGINGKNGASRKKGVIIPQEFSGKCHYYTNRQHLYNLKNEKSIFSNEKNKLKILFLLLNCKKKKK